MTISHADLLYALFDELHWVKGTLESNQAEFWYPSRDKEADGVSAALIVPKNKDAADYVNMIDGVLNRLSDMYGARYDHAKDYVKEVVFGAYDPIILREDTGTASGLISWSSGSHLIASAEGLLGAAARAAVSTQKRFGATNYKARDSVLHDSFMGQTQIGSYIVTAYVPSNHAFEVSDSEKSSIKQKVITGRAVTDTLTRALKAFDGGISEIIGSGDSDSAYEIFDETVQEGVSYELLDAISQLSDTNESSVSVSFASSNNATPNKVYELVVSPVMQPIVKKAKDYLERTESPVSTRVVGEIVRLDNSLDKGQHEIRIRTFGKVIPSTVTVFLNADQYVKAIEAHRTQHVFSVTGSLQRMQKGAEIRDPWGVSIEDTLLSQNVSNDLKLNGKDKRKIAEGQGSLF